MLTFIVLAPIVTEREREPEYLARSREGTYGCETLGERKPSLLFVGDSHTYADWDFAHFQTAFPKSKVGGCGIGGLYFDSVLLLIDHLESKKLIPKTIIYGASFRQFTEGKSKDDQISEHAKLIARIQPAKPWYQPNLLANANHLYTWAGRFLPALAKKSADQIQTEQLQFHGLAISSAHEDVVEKLMEQTQNISRRSWIEYLSSAKIQDSYLQKAKRFCELIMQQHTQLVVVELPESPFLLKLYKTEELKKYDRILNELQSCSALTLTRSSFAGRVGNRHFLNRPLRRDFPYERINQASDGLVPAYDIDLLFDLDHANLVGAEIITDTLIESIRKSELAKKLNDAL